MPALPEVYLRICDSDQSAAFDWVGFGLFDDIVADGVNDESPRRVRRESVLDLIVGTPHSIRCFAGAVHFYAGDSRVHGVHACAFFERSPFFEFQRFQKARAARIACFRSGNDLVARFQSF